MIVATVSHLLQTPAVATAIAHELGTDKARGLRHLRGLRRVLPRDGPRRRHGPRRRAKHVLVIGVERLTDITSLDDRGTAFIFADGAGAAVIGPSDEVGIGPVVWGSDGEQFDLIRQDEDWRDVLVQDSPTMPHLVMQGAAVFRWASFEMAKIAQQTLDKTGITVDDLDVFVPHQANMRIIDAMARSMKLPATGGHRPRHRRAGQHLRRVHPARPRSDDRGGHRQERRHRAAHRLRRRAGLRRPDRQGPLVPRSHPRPVARPRTPTA